MKEKILINLLFALNGNPSLAGSFAIDLVLKTTAVDCNFILQRQNATIKTSPNW